MMPDVSIIIATYNVENYIERAIQSALAQRDIEVEVIVVDDGSTDKTWDAVCALNDPRVKSMRLDRNSGPSAARNAGLDLATGEWIAILDGDDTMEPDRLARLVRRARAEKADIVVDNLEVRREADGAVYPMFEPVRFAAMKRLDLARFIQGNQCFLGGGEALGYLNPVFSTTFLRDHALHYDPNIRIGEDYMLMAEALASCAVCVVEAAAGYHYTARAGSISHRLSLDDIGRIAAGDQKFLARHTLTSTAVKAQAKRTRRLNEARAFTLFVDALKRRDLRAVLATWLAHPLVPRHLWRAVWVRLQRALGGMR
ncbi:MAG TPA: glycosyl transferase [Rhodospirillaceae bacterium]|nr:glycosyl transferase [Rhodospirillaceae bacterium]